MSTKNNYAASSLHFPGLCTCCGSQAGQRPWSGILYSLLSEVGAAVTPGPPDNGFESRRIVLETTLTPVRSSRARLLPNSLKRSATPAFTACHSLPPKS
ncbi:hypothetical protein MRX96_045033 [Rhipicephalus microplus]